MKKVIEKYIAYYTHLAIIFSLGVFTGGVYILSAQQHHEVAMESPYSSNGLPILDPEHHSVMGDGV